MLQLGNIGPQYAMRTKFEDLVGAETTAEFYKAWLANHTTKADIDAMAKWGFNSVRLPMHFDLYTLPVEREPVKGQNTWLEQGFELTDALLAWCKANNIYLILDLHAAPGGQGNDLAISDRDASKPSLWQSPENQLKTIALWRKLAQRYANEPWIGGYDIINEPNWGFESAEDKNGCKEKKNEPLKKLMVDITKAIREVDSKHMIVIEANCWGNNYSGVLPAWDINMVLSFHKYWNNNSQGEVANILQLREKHNMPVWLGESGENSNAWFADAINLVESNGIGWAFWPLKKIGFNNPLQVQANPGYLKIVEYLNGRGERPTAAEAKKALMQLAQHDILFENNIYHPDVIDAMLRQPNSDVAVSFAPHIIKSSGGSIAAVDYDMGRHTYFDVDAGNYYISTGGERTLWNDGLTYRNDGVDIGVDIGVEKTTSKHSEFFIDKIESGEWIQYTVTAEKAAAYKLKARVKSLKENAAISIMVNNEIVLPSSLIAQSDIWKIQALTSIKLVKGTNIIRVKATQGGYQLSKLVLENN